MVHILEKFNVSPLMFSAMCNVTIELRVVNEYFETKGAEILTVETFIPPSFPHQQHALPTTGDWLILA